MNLKKDIKYKINIKKPVDKYLMKLSKKNKKDLKIILTAIKEISNNPYNSVRLTDKTEKERRIRKGKYRIIFTINTELDEIQILKIGKRTSIYEE